MATTTSRQVDHVPVKGTSLCARDPGAVYLINLRFAGAKAKVPRIGEAAVRGGGKRT